MSLGSGMIGVAHLAERDQAFLGLLQAATTFEAEGHRHERDHECAGLGGDLGHRGSGAAAGATAHTGDQKHEVAVFHHSGDLFTVGLGGLAAEFRVAAGTETTSQRSCR